MNEFSLDATLMNYVCLNIARYLPYYFFLDSLPLPQDICLCAEHLLNDSFIPPVHLGNFPGGIALHPAGEVESNSIDGCDLQEINSFSVGQWLIN